MRHGFTILMMVVLALPVAGQVAPGGAAEAIENAEVHANFAATAGARTYAPTLYGDAMIRLERARKELENGEETRAARAAIESAEASMAAEAKSKWLSTVAEIRTLRSDLDRLGARLEPLGLIEEKPILLPETETSRERVAHARAIVDEALEFQPTGPEGDLARRAELLVGSAEKIVRQTKNNAVADHLAYVSSMLARQAIYGTRLRELSVILPELRLRRTELAQAEAAREAELARREREDAERELEIVRRQLEEEQGRREVEQAEIRRLRDNLQKQQEVLVAELSGARTARIEAEQRLDHLRGQYEAALRDSGIESENVESLRLRVEDQELRLEEIRREELESERALKREIEALRADLRVERERGRIPEEELRRQERELREREAQIEQMRRARNENLEMQRRAEEEFRLRTAEADRRMREMARQSEELERDLSSERAAREQAEQELQSMRAEVAERERIERERQEEMEGMKAQLAELAETRADERGFIVTLPGLFFDTGMATLKTGTKANLSKVAGLLEQMDRVRIIVEGHTDSVGSAEMNQKLSEARAAAVRDYLVTAGVDPVEVTTVGRGESQPIASNDSAEGRSRNRRVEIVIEER